MFQKDQSDCFAGKRDDGGSDEDDLGKRMRSHGVQQGTVELSRAQLTLTSLPEERALE